MHNSFLLNKFSEIDELSKHDFDNRLSHVSSEYLNEVIQGSVGANFKDEIKIFVVLYKHLHSFKTKI